MSNSFKNFLDIKEHYVGNDRRSEMLSDIMKNNTFLPNTVVYKDIDSDFKRFVEEELKIVSEEGKVFPTMTLFSNQRFSEYTQSWKFTDQNKNLLLNFKTINRENNPQYGKIQNGYFNIPGKERFYTIEKRIVQDDNGSESFLITKMRQHTAIDLRYKLSIFTTKYELVNKFNELVNISFNSRQCYIKPNGHFMPMTLENITDESSYSIDDRQFYGQSYEIKVMAYIITEEDYRVEEVPLKRGFSFIQMARKKNIPDVEIEECDNGKDVILTIFYPSKCDKNYVHFKVDIDFIIETIELENIKNNYKIYINGDILEEVNGVLLRDGDEVKVSVNKTLNKSESKFIIKGKSLT